MNKLDRLYKKIVLKEGVGKDFILFKVIKMFFNLKNLRFLEFLIIKNAIKKIIKNRNIR